MKTSKLARKGRRRKKTKEKKSRQEIINIIINTIRRGREFTVTLWDKVVSALTAQQITIEGNSQILHIPNVLRYDIYLLLHVYRLDSVSSEA